MKRIIIALLLILPLTSCNKVITYSLITKDGVIVEDIPLRSYCQELVDKLKVNGVCVEYRSIL